MSEPESMSMPSESPSDRAFRVAALASPDDPHDLSTVLSRVLGLHPTDALVHARYAPGLFPDLLTADDASRLAEEISATGVQAVVVPGEAIPDLSDAEVVHHAICADSGLQIIELHGRQEQTIPWEGVDLISVGQIPQETSRHFVTGDMNAVHTARRTGPSTLETPLSPGPEAWIACLAPDRMLRIDHKRMNYEYLGDRKSDSATANFRLFLDDLVARARQAYLTPATRAYLEHQSVEDYSFDSAEALKHVTILHLVMHRRDGRTFPGAPPGVDARPAISPPGSP